MEVCKLPEIGHQFAGRDQPEVKPIEIRMHRDVEPHSVGDDRYGNVVFHFGAGEIDRLSGAWDVRDHDVRWKIHPVSEPQPRRQAHGSSCDNRWSDLGTLHQRVGRDQLELTFRRRHRCFASRKPFERIIAVGW